MAERLGRTEALSLVAMAAAVLAVLAATPGRGSSDVVPPWADDRLDAAGPGTRVLNDWNSVATSCGAIRMQIS